MEKKIQFKSFALKFDDVDTKGTIRGYASTFGNVDLGFDVVDKGAFKKSIKESGGKWPILADHMATRQVGWNFRAEEDDYGLKVEGQLDLNVQDAREKYSLIQTAFKLGASMGLSIGYMTIKAEPDRDQPMVRHLKELKLFEYSVVTFPMNTEAMVTAAKGLVSVDRARFIISELEKQGIKRDEIESALRKGAAPTPADPNLKVQSKMDDLIKQMRQG